jgi:pyrroloquinoline quinone biosynthesis protein B
MKHLKFCFLIFVLSSFTGNTGAVKSKKNKPVAEILLLVLGTIQDAGSPQVGCKKDCCKDLFQHPDKNRRVVSLGLVDAANQKKYIFEATPDFTQQAKALKNYASFSSTETPDGIFLTHAHIGHYTGLMYLGKEAMNADNILVYAMPRMKNFLEQNGPWSQLVKNKNIVLQDLNDQKEIQLTPDLKVIPFTVPHRDEFSETVGYTIIGPNKKAMFIPDIDKWEKWNTNIIDAIAKVDYAFIDGTFYDAAEINNPQDPVSRDIATIPHPFIIESMNRFKGLPATEKKKIYFIHFNHTNPVINKKSKQYRQVIQNGFNIARIGDIIKL